MRSPLFFLAGVASLRLGPAPPADVPCPAARALAPGPPARRCGRRFSLRRELEPTAALRLFLSPSTGATPVAPTPLRYFLRCYNLIVSKLVATHIFHTMESLLSQLPASFPYPREQLLCRVITAYGRACLPTVARRAFVHPAFPTSRTARALNALRHALLACPTPLCDLLSIYREAAIPPNVCFYNILMRAAALASSVDHARHMFDEMLQQGIAPTVITFATLVAALCNCGQLEEAFEVKEIMARRYNVRPNAHVYASLMKGLYERGKVDAAVRLKEEMAENAKLELDSPLYATLVRKLFRIGRKGEVIALLEEMKGMGIAADIDF